MTKTKTNLRENKTFKYGTPLEIIFGVEAVIVKHT